MPMTFARLETDDPHADLEALRRLVTSAWVPCRCIGQESHVRSCRVGSLLSEAERAVYRLETVLIAHMAVAARARTRRALRDARAR